MADITLDPRQLGIRLRGDSKGLSKAVLRAALAAAQRGKAFLVKRSPVDRGLLRNAWRVVKTAYDVDLVNDQPYAGVIERGSRPFKISSTGIFYLKGWVMRKFKSGEILPHGSQTRIVWARGQEKRDRLARGQSLIKSTRKKSPKGFDLEREAESMAYAIAKTFEKVGMKGKRFILKNLPEITSLIDQVIAEHLSNFFNRPYSENT